MPSSAEPMLKVTHHSGQERILNPANIEAVYADAAGFAVVRMASGVEFTIAETYAAFCDAMASKWDLTMVKGPEPEHPEQAQKGPLPPPTGDQSPILPEKGIEYGQPGYHEAKEERKAEEHQQKEAEHKADEPKPEPKTEHKESSHKHK